MAKPLTDEQWKARANALHNGKYEYLDEYVNSRTRMRVVCPVEGHGEFSIMAANHVKKPTPNGCPKCAHQRRVANRNKNPRRRITSTEEFIAHARKAHGDRYDYSETVWAGMMKKVRIRCPEHGVFEQLAMNHIKYGKPHGCDKCGRAEQHASINKGIEYFLKVSREVHGDKFDYSLVEYVNDRTPVTIICPEHGPFEQVPNCHKTGDGCSKCRDDMLARDRRHTTEQFIEKSIAAFGEGRFDYSMSEYRGAFDPIKVRCIDCDHVFEQLPTHHIRGWNGCDICGHSTGGFQNDLPGTLYYLRVVKAGQVLYKVGITNKTPEERFRRDMEHITVLSTVTFENGKDARDLERLYLQEYAEYRYKGEKIMQQGGDTELFTIDILGLDREAA